MHGGDRGDTHVNGVHPAAGEFDTPVLRQSPFGDVHVGKQLDTRRDGGELGDGRSQDRLEHAVNAETDLDILFVGFDMDVGGSGLLCAGEDVVDKSDDGCLFCQVAQRLFGISGTSGTQRLVRSVVVGGQEPVDERAACEDEFDIGLVEASPELRNMTGFVGRGEGQDSAVCIPEQWEADIRIKEIVGDVGVEGDISRFLLVQRGQSGGLGVDGQHCSVLDLALLDESLVEGLRADGKGFGVCDLKALGSQGADLVHQRLTLQIGLDGWLCHGQYISSCWCFAISSRETL